MASDFAVYETIESCEDSYAIYETENGGLELVGQNDTIELFMVPDSDSGVIVGRYVSNFNPMGLGDLPVYDFVRMMPTASQLSTLIVSYSGRQFSCDMWAVADNTQIDTGDLIDEEKSFNVGSIGHPDEK